MQDQGAGRSEIRARFGQQPLVDCRSNALRYARAGRIDEAMAYGFAAGRVFESRLMAHYATQAILNAVMDEGR